MGNKFELPQTNYYLYDLQCEKGKRYIGITSCQIKRMAEHRKGKGSRWTRIYKPIKINSVISLGDISYAEACIIEDYETLKLLDQGEQGVRGGHYINPKIKFNPEKIKEMIAKIPEDYKELTFEQINIDFIFRYKKQNRKKKPKKQNPWSKQEKKTKYELEVNKRKFT